MTEKALAVGHIPSGLFIVAAQKSDQSIVDGYLASWVQQVSFEPLLVSLAVRPGRPAYDLIVSGVPFCINVVGEHEKTYLKHFWKGYDPNSNPFKELPTQIGEHGGLMLTQAKSSIECRFKESFHPGDHELVIAEVLSSTIHEDKTKPMVHVRKSGLDY